MSAHERLTRVCGPNTPPELLADLDAFRAAAIAEFEAYPGELAMLRGVLGVVRVIAQHGDMDELRRVVAEHYADERAAYAEQGEKDTRGGESTPDFFQTGHTYSTTVYGGPLTVHGIGTHPSTGERYAHGWVHYEDNDSWAPVVVCGLFDRFTDVTEGGADHA